MVVESQSPTSLRRTNDRSGSFAFPDRVVSFGGSMAKFINKALMEEASKYDTLSHDSAETPFLFSTHSFVFGRALVVRGSSG